MILDIRVLDRQLALSAELLRDCYKATADGSGGWYHELGKPPGATATAIALASFVDCGEGPDHLDQALRFLKNRQHAEGGWTTRTSGGVPVVEATAWIAWSLTRARCDLEEGAPDLHLAAQWLTDNQNPDGGWGSVAGAPSRVWLTCLSLRALGLLDPHADAVAQGVRWLLSNRVHDPVTRVRVWGQTGSGSPTVTHTSLALVTMAELRPGELQQVLPAFRWLTTKLAADPRNMHKWIETYTVAGPDGNEWRLNLWHFGLAIALSALLHHPSGPPVNQIDHAFKRIITVTPGTHIWGDDENPGDRQSLWSLWWSLQALASLRRLPLFLPDDLVVWLEDAVIIRRGSARRKPLFALLPAMWLAGIQRLAARFWAYMVLMPLVLVVGGGVLAGWWPSDVFWVGLIIPLALIPLQEAFSRRRRGG
jgi:hypothetical protein